MIAYSIPKFKLFLIQKLAIAESRETANLLYTL